MPSTPPSAARQRVLTDLKLHGPARVAAVAERLALTEVAVRQHLAGLEEAGLAVSEPIEGPPEGEQVSRGRPGRQWRATRAANGLFPDRHHELAGGLLELLAADAGGETLDRVLAARLKQQTAEARAALPPASAPLRNRVDALAAIRTGEGYMAEVRADPAGDGLLLIEHHCPICTAAETCGRLCDAELTLFRQALGTSTVVERTEHLIAGGARCVYRIQERAGQASGDGKEGVGGEQTKTSPS